MAQKIIFMGSPSEVIHPLKILKTTHERGEIQLVAVVSQPARPVGRGRQLQDTPVSEFAKTELAGIPLFTPERASSPEFLDELRRLNPDIIVTASYGQILSEAFIQTANRAVINIHPSLLPQYRGATPVQTSLLNGDAETGITILFTVKKLDAGSIILQKKSVIAASETAADLMERLFQESGPMLLDALVLLKDKNFVGTAQDESSVTQSKKIAKEYGQLDWTNSAADLINRYRAFYPWPGVYTHHQENRILLHELDAQPQANLQNLKPGEFVFDKALASLIVGTKSGCVAVKKLQKSGGKIIDARDFFNSLNGPRLFSSSPALKNTNINAPKIIVGVSGRGRSLENLLKFSEKNPGSFSVCGVFANTEQCIAVQKARDAKIPVFVLKYTEPDFPSNNDLFLKWVTDLNAELIALAGFIKKFPLQSKASLPVLNIHPSLLPKYGGKGMYGARVHESVSQNKESESGATVHYVTEHYDDGEIVMQERVQISPTDSAQTIADKVFALECEIYPKAIQKALKSTKAKPT